MIGSAGADVAKSAGEEAAKKIGEIYDSEGKLLLEKFRLGQKTILEFKKQMAELVTSFKPEYKKPLFVLVDELDRCRPPYAVALLERVKHLFDVDDVVFVMATDTEQLRHSIAALYGVNFAAGRYLLRFFDQTYRFEDAAIDGFVRQQFSDIDQSKLYGSSALNPAEFSARAFKAFNLSLRDIEQCTDILRNCVTAWSFKNPIVLLVLLPLVILQQQRMEVSYGTIRERLSERLGPIRWANLDFNVRDQSRNRHLFDGLDLLQQFIGQATSYNIPQITSEEGGPAGHTVIREILIHEMAARFRGGYPTHEPPVSVVRGYPAFVRSVGRLTPG